MEYKEVLLKAFPKSLGNEVMSVLDILPFDENRINVSNGHTYIIDNLIRSPFFVVRLDNDDLSIPYRIYFNEPDAQDERDLTETQKIILSCIYLRHHDGYLRQRRLEQLIDKNEYWIVPHTLQLLGGYVLEILQVLDKVITNENIEYYRRFVNENPQYWELTVNRMISYWDAYYRRPTYPILKEYSGQKIVDRIQVT